MLYGCLFFLSWFTIVFFFDIAAEPVFITLFLNVIGTVMFVSLFGRNRERLKMLGLMIVYLSSLAIVCGMEFSSYLLVIYGLSLLFFSATRFKRTFKNFWEEDENG
ncbi:hypothetical protein J7J81_02055 [bacterium]|nr:hypothetical protein [bacterium]